MAGINGKGPTHNKLRPPVFGRDAGAASGSLGRAIR
jgi:hypothetical protein